MKEVMNVNQSNSKIDKITCENEVITNPKDMASKFNEFFVGAGKRVVQTIKETNCKPEQYLPPPSQHKLEFAAVNQGELVNVMRALQPKSSTDIEGISIKLLREVAIEISWPLTHIFNLSLTNGIFPNALKTSRIIPIHKCGLSDLCDNY